MRHYPLYIFDLDGTLYRGRKVLDHAAETLATLRGRGAKIRFLTNNSGATLDMLATKLLGMGFAAETTEVMNSGVGAAAHATAMGIQKVFVVGEDALKETLRNNGLETVDADEPAEAVIAGICRGFTYQWLDQAQQQIRAGAAFIATNQDATYPLEGGRLEPGAGSIIAAIQVACGVAPKVIGKPEPDLIIQILSESGVSPNDALVVGDRINTDIEAGRAAGCPTWLVLTGVESTLPEGQPGGPDLRGLLVD